MVVDILHPDTPTPKKSEVREALAKQYKSASDHIIVFGFKTQFGGGKTSGFALMYDSVADAKRIEPRFRAVGNFEIVRVAAHSSLAFCLKRWVCSELLSDAWPRIICTLLRKTAKLY